MMACKQKRACLGSLNRRIDIVRRNLGPTTGDSAEPNLVDTTVMSVRCAIKTHGGTNEWSRVTVGDRSVTHTFTIRHTTVAFDARDRVRDGAGNDYEILKVEDINEQGAQMKIYAARLGDNTKAVNV